MTTSIGNSHDHDDLQSIQRQIHEKKTGMLDSTRRMLGLINESEAVGVNTAAELIEQREKLENIEKRCDSIDANLVSAQQNINKLNSIFGGIKNYFHPPKSTMPKSASQPQLSNTAKKKTAAAQQAAATAINTRPTNPNNDTDTYFGKARSGMDDIERDTEDGLHDVHLGVSRLKLLALQMNEELESQKPLTDRLGIKINHLDETVNKKNKDMKNILLR
ncbi:unnamed protein product [Rotaria magnacalcarata]|uniref:t-SNARE coiled-coil homology domain-containing protein n=3 Tax=Rotaria magnacalcarata TaxID=392030 RepID=A0A818ZCW8_9BILA|nr:unnamed protein product [Rotaria magnacalcarata]CAF2091412.1 unnamed protein product [Rotaria magnacalcarata]CAF3767426.1 unnamed protein product [Rotaria magnacalcarata]CAF4002691.1 unnamed protein product [Rotaria magnacalcarata]